MSGAALLLVVLSALFGACSEPPLPEPAPLEAPVREIAPSKGPAPATVQEDRPPTPPIPPPALLPDPEVGPNSVRATVRVIDLDGRPVPGMAPIATVDASAFQRPLATGPLTGPDGRTTFAFPGDQHVFIRAWDPNMKYFANNFYEALPEEGALDEVLDIVMVQGARLEVLLYGPDSQPLANQPVQIMLIHPTQGPWWPARAKTDPIGLAVFETVPAGEFTVEFHVEPGLHTELSGIALRPGGVKDLGKLLLQQGAAS
ncbi:MAG: hypothetical protein IT368_01235 [Candidatus Hydrogenedentes bacterium]|nr:hypothetical protein [Candidatus Hydrogenedentota bacterium]